LPPPTGPEQVEDLLALLEPLRGVAEEADDPLDRLLHAVELGEGRVDADGPVHEDPPKPDILGGIDDHRLANGLEDTFRGTRVEAWSFRQPSRYSEMDMSVSRRDS
jgi:hypothetical protein